MQSVSRTTTTTRTTRTRTTYKLLDRDALGKKQNKYRRVVCVPLCVTKTDSVREYVQNDTAKSIPTYTGRREEQKLLSKLRGERLEENEDTRAEQNWQSILKSQIKLS